MIAKIEKELYVWRSSSSVCVIRQRLRLLPDSMTRAKSLVSGGLARVAFPSSRIRTDLPLDGNFVDLGFFTIRQQTPKPRLILMGLSGGEEFMPTPASSGTNQYRCNACGRYFNTQGELSQHELQCRAAKEATKEGREELARQDREPHLPNDQDSKEHPFQHGTRQKQ
jgi:hypothetical protein